MRVHANSLRIGVVTGIASAIFRCRASSAAGLSFEIQCLHYDKGKPAVRRGRKASDLSQKEAAGLPKGGS